MNQEKDYVEGFFEQVTYFGRLWTLHIRHYLALAEEERERYEVSDGQFLIHMYSVDQSNTFKVFLDDEDPFRWISDASPLIADRELIEVIGNRIELKHNHFEEDSQGSTSGE